MSRYKVLRGMGDRWRLGSGVIDHGLLPYVCGTRMGHWKGIYDGVMKQLKRFKEEYDQEPEYDQEDSLAAYMCQVAYEESREGFKEDYDHVIEAIDRLGGRFRRCRNRKAKYYMQRNEVILQLCDACYKNNNITYTPDHRFHLNSKEVDSLTGFRYCIFKSNCYI